MFERIAKMLLKLALTLFILGLLLLGIARLVTGLYARPKTYTAADVPARRVAIVFGAGLWRNGTATPVLQDRVQTAANLYFDGKVEKLLMSGDNRFVDYNEPAVMRSVWMPTYAFIAGCPCSIGMRANCPLLWPPCGM
jgi:SanA protein